MSPVVLQTIRTQWTKKSRGEPGAARRNAVPDVLLLPSFEPRPGPAEALWHDVQSKEPDFSPSEALQWTTLSSVRVPGLDLRREDDNRVRVDLWGKRLLVVDPAEVLAVRFNWVDDVMDDGWRISVYHKVSLHLAHGFAPTRRLFLSPANHTVDRMRDLP